MRAWITLAGLTLAAFVYVTAETLPVGLLPQIAYGLGTSQSAVGLLVTAYGLVVVLVTFPLTRLTQRWPRRRLIAGLLLAFAVSSGVCAVASSYAVLLVGRVATAFGQALFWAVITPAAASLFPAVRRGRALAVLYAGSSAAPLLGVPLGTWLGQQAGWRAPFAGLAALGLVVMIAIALLMPDRTDDSETSRGTEPDAGRFRVLVIITALTATGSYAAFTCITPYLTDVAGVGESQIGPVLLVRGGAALGGALIAGFLPQRAGIVLMFVTQTAALTVQYAWPAATVVATAAAAATLSGFATIMGARLLRVAPGSTDLASAAISISFNVGITTGALTGSALLAHDAVRASALTGAAISVLATVVALAEPRFASVRKAENPKEACPAAENAE